jgi:large subunit ribosomal protein L25
MSTDNVLKTETRSDHGSRASRKARRNGRVPANIFGHGKPNAHVTIDAHDLDMALLTTDQVFTLVVEGAEESCLVKEVQYDTFAQNVLHVDLARIDLTEEVSVVVALEFRGNAAGFAEGGVQVIHHPTISVLCPAGSIPAVIVVDITEVELGQTLHAVEISLPEGVKLDGHQMRDSEPIVGVVVPKKVEEVVEEDAETLLEGEEAAADGEAKEGDDAAKDGDADKKDEK